MEIGFTVKDYGIVISDVVKNDETFYKVDIQVYDMHRPKTREPVLIWTRTFYLHGELDTIEKFLRDYDNVYNLNGSGMDNAHFELWETIICNLKKT